MTQQDVKSTEITVKYCEGKNIIEEHNEIDSRPLGGGW